MDAACREQRQGIVPDARSPQPATAHHKT
jgi:hypothetical protein